MELMKIQENVQQVAEAVASVIGVDVTVTDACLIRIAGTGKYRSCLGQHVSGKGVFAFCLQEGTPYIIRNPRDTYVCMQCEVQDTCMEYAEMVCPIKTGDKICGVMGLIAFDDVQKKRLLGNERSTLDFLEKMSNLIAAELVDMEKTQEIKLLASQLSTIINVMDKALIIADCDGKIKFFNEKADHMFLIGERRIRDMSGILTNSDMENIFGQGLKILGKEIEYEQNGSVVKGVVNTEVFYDENEMKSVVFIIDEFKQLLNIAKSIISSSVVTEFDNIIHDSPAMDDIILLSQKASGTDSTVLITGESGTGKELFARAIHYESRRSTEPFVAINCSAIPENLFESELFGYEEGAFTGALKGGHPGKFELADKGTLLLDEIGDMPIHLQPKLLRVLQDGKVMRIGGKNQISVDVRIIASTNADLEEKVRNREFREDLYYRLNVIPLTIPPLRERRQDIGRLTDYFIVKYSRKLCKDVSSIDSSAMRMLELHEWRGNVRELENVVEYAVSMADSHRITVSALPKRMREAPASVAMVAGNEEICSLDELERRELFRAINRYGKYGDNVDIICSLLGIGRATFYRKVKKYNL